MYGRLQEDVAWTRLQDRQREMENRTLGYANPLTGRLIGWFGALLRHAADAAVRRLAPRDPALPLEPCDTVQEVA